MYYFYLNFPNFSSRIILIHVKTFHHVRPENNSYNGFWAGPFKTKYDVEFSLKNLNTLMKSGFQYAYCDCCN